MTDFATEDNIVSALKGAGHGGAGCRQEFYKTSLTAVAGFDYSGWMMAGAPAAGVAPTVWAHPTQATIGAWCPKLVNAGTQTNRVLQIEATMANAGQNMRIVDRVGHMAGLSGTSIAAQTVGATLTTPAADGRCAADGSDVAWYLEWYAATGSTPINVTLAVTYNDDSTGNVVVAIPASVPAYRKYRILPAVAGKTIKAMSTATNSASTGTAGNFGVTAERFLCSSSVPSANYTDKQDYAYLAMPDVGTNACITATFWTTATSLGVCQGAIVIGAA